MLRAGRKSRGGSNTTLLLIALGLACLVAVVAVVAVHRGMFGQVPGKPRAEPLPTIVKPGENWFSPSDIAVIDGDTARRDLAR